MVNKEVSVFVNMWMENFLSTTNTFTTSQTPNKTKSLTTNLWCIFVNEATKKNLIGSKRLISREKNSLLKSSEMLSIPERGSQTRNDIFQKLLAPHTTSQTTI
jgi:hypothetical protein